MQTKPSRPFLLIVVEPANDRDPSPAPFAFWRIRWLLTGSIGRRPGPSSRH